MESLEVELERARAVDVELLADAIESIGFECTRCGGCCKGEADEPHTATVFPDEVRELQTAAAEANATGETADEFGGGADESGSGADGSGSGATDEAEGSATDRSHDRSIDRSTDRSAEYDWRDVARPMPYGLSAGPDGPEGETFEWALQTDGCGDCRFYEETDVDGEGDTDDRMENAVNEGRSGDSPDDQPGSGYCTVHEHRPLICQTYPFSLALGGTSQPMGEAVDAEGMVRAHECEGLGRDIDRAAALELAETLRERAIRELEEAIAVRDAYEPVETAPGDTVVYDSEGPKTPDGSPLE